MNAARAVVWLGLFFATACAQTGEPNGTALELSGAAVRRLQPTHRVIPALQMLCSPVPSM